MAPTRDESTILVIDDSPTNLRLLLETLQDAGYRTLIAPTGERALRQMALIRPDLILLDVMMPGIDGFETCRRIKESPDTREIPVIFITALAKSSEKLRGFEMGGVDYITKPFQRDEVLSRVRTHLTLRRQQAALEAANATKDRFFSIVAHDMRGAFNSLFAYAEILGEQIEETGDERLRETAGKLNRSVDATFRLLENLLQWSRLQRGKISFFPCHVALRDLTTDILALNRGHAERKGVALENRVPAEIRLWADERMLHTVFRNLVTNAVKFTASGGRVAVSAEETETEALISVTDDGVGIPSAQVENLFRIDVKYQQAGTAGETGTGLGLALCHELMEKNGGTIRISSRVGVGTTATVSLPPGPQK
jgi:two-component system, sensor histidine kinase and response regulator